MLNVQTNLIIINYAVDLVVFRIFEEFFFCSQPFILSTTAVNVSCDTYFEVEVRFGVP